MLLLKMNVNDCVDSSCNNPYDESTMNEEARALTNSSAIAKGGGLCEEGATAQVDTAAKRTKSRVDVDVDDVALTFPQRLMEILDDEENSDIISWLPHGRGFKIERKKLFEQNVLTKHFHQSSKYSSFTRKLNRWGFVRVTRGPETGAYYNKHFQRGGHRLLQRMSCQKTSSQSSSCSPGSLGSAAAMASHASLNWNSFASAPTEGLHLKAPPSILTSPNFFPASNAAAAVPRHGSFLKPPPNQNLGDYSQVSSSFMDNVTSMHRRQLMMLQLEEEERKQKQLLMMQLQKQHQHQKQKELVQMQLQEQQKRQLLQMQLQHEMSYGEEALRRTILQRQQQQQEGGKDLSLQIMLQREREQNASLLMLQKHRQQQQVSTLPILQNRHHQQPRRQTHQDSSMRLPQIPQQQQQQRYSQELVPVPDALLGMNRELLGSRGVGEAVVPTRDFSTANSLSSLNKGMGSLNAAYNNNSNSANNNNNSGTNSSSNNDALPKRIFGPSFPYHFRG